MKNTKLLKHHQLDQILFLLKKFFLFSFGRFLFSLYLAIEVINYYLYILVISGPSVKSFSPDRVERIYRKCYQ